MAIRERPLRLRIRKNEKWNSGGRRTILPLFKIAWNERGCRKPWFCGWPSDDEATPRENIMDEEKSRAPGVLLVGAAAALLLIGIFYLVARLTPAPAKTVEQPLPMVPAEQAYVPQIQFCEPNGAPARNFLHPGKSYLFRA